MLERIYNSYLKAVCKLYLKSSCKGLSSLPLRARKRASSTRASLPALYCFRVLSCYAKRRAHEEADAKKSKKDSELQEAKGWWEQRV